MNPTTLNAILKLIDLLAVGLQMAPHVREAYNQNKAKVQTMIDEGRDPTPEEWEQLLEDVQSNTNELND